MRDQRLRSMSIIDWKLGLCFSFVGLVEGAGNGLGELLNGGVTYNELCESESADLLPTRSLSLVISTVTNTVNIWWKQGTPLSIISTLPSNKTQNICIKFVQCWSNVEDVGPTLYRCYTIFLYLLGSSKAFFQSLKSVTFFIEGLCIRDKMCDEKFSCKIGHGQFVKSDRLNLVRTIMKRQIIFHPHPRCVLYTVCTILRISRTPN